MLIPVPPMEFDHCDLEDKSTHHQCTYSYFQVTGSMFFYKTSEKFNTNTRTHQLRHVCNINYASDTYGEDSERLPMKKMCKVFL